MAHRPAIAAEIEAIRAEIAQAKAAQGNQAASDEDYWELVSVGGEWWGRSWGGRWYLIAVIVELYPQRL